MDAQGKIYLLQTIHLCSCGMQDKNETIDMNISVTFSCKI